MNTERLRCLCLTLTLVFTAHSSHADVINVGTFGPRIHAPEQTIELSGQVFFFTAPPVGWNHVNICPGTTVRLELSAIYDGATQISWWKDGELIAETGSDREWKIPSFSSVHEGDYQARFTFSGSTQFSADAVLKVSNLKTVPLKNISTRATLSPGSASVTSGFVVENDQSVLTNAHYVLIRVIGPSLSDYDVEKPVPDPVMDVHSAASGDAIGIAFPEVYYPDGTTPRSRYYDWVRRVSAAVGAFPIPLPVPGEPAPPEDAMLIALSPGAYTVTVHSATGGSGEVMLEVYEVPTEIAKALEGDPPPPWPDVVDVPIPVEPGN